MRRLLSSDKPRLDAPLSGIAEDRVRTRSYVGLAHWMTAGSVILVGLALAAAGIRNFSRAATPVPTNEPTRVLVTTGIHGWTRNPIYLGLFLVYGGIGIASRSPWTLILTLPLAITIRCGVVGREEAYLERRFGDAYREYGPRAPLAVMSTLLGNA